MVDNQYSLLDRTDEVYVDAPATGYSRLLPHGKPSETFGVDQDAAAFAQFIERYLSEYGRWNSPKYLFGESYGTIRSAAVARLMESGFGQAVQFNGIVLMSSALNVDLLWDDESVGGNDWPFVLFLRLRAQSARIQDELGVSFAHQRARRLELAPPERSRRRRGTDGATQHDCRPLRSDGGESGDARFPAQGYYDMSTPFFQQDYDFAHLHLPAALRRNLTIALSSPKPPRSRGATG